MLDTKRKSTGFDTNSSSVEVLHKDHILGQLNHHHRPSDTDRPICSKVSWLVVDKAAQGSRHHKHKNSRVSPACLVTCKASHHQGSMVHLVHHTTHLATVSNKVKDHHLHRQVSMVRLNYHFQEKRIGTLIIW